MAWKKIAGAGIAASAGAALLFAAVNPASAAGHYPEKAFALQVKALGENVLEPTPYVESPDGETVKESIVSIPAGDSNPTLSLPISADAPLNVQVLEALAEKNHAEARAADLNLGGDAGITARVITATCKKAEGSTEIANLVIGNNDLSGVVANPEPNTKIGVPGLLEITLNEQYMNDDGSLTVNAVHVAVAPELSSTELGQLTTALDEAGGLEAGAGMTELSALGDVQANLKKAMQAPSEGLVDVVVASATCGNATDDGDNGGDDGDDDDNGDDGDNGGDDGTAPKPTPVETQHAVTG